MSALSEATLKGKIRQKLVDLGPSSKQISREELDAAISAGIHRARQYGFMFEYNIVLFVVLQFLIGHDFDLDPFVQAVLKDQTIDPEDRMDALFERLPHAHWSAITAKTDKS